MSIRVLVTGSREYTDRVRVFAELNAIHAVRHIALLIHGAARGADALGHAWADYYDVEPLPFPAKWNDITVPGAVIRQHKLGGKYNILAGKVRNSLMLAEGKPDLVVAFSTGRGTADMVKKARAAGVQVLEVK